jgi:hypothetical protein
MKKRAFGAAIGIGMLGATLVTGGTASADSCHGDIVGKEIASTWPYAKVSRDLFPPPKGGFALWVETFGFEGQPGAENQAIRDFCKSLGDG